MKMKKIMTAVLAMVMLFSVAATPVLAEETSTAACEHEYACKICTVKVPNYGELSQKVCGKCGDTKYEAAHNHTLNEVGVCTCCEINILGLMNQAYMYAFPLVLMDVTAEKVTNTETATYTQAPTNQFVHVPAFADANAKDIVLPNVDTLYSQAFLDLSETAVVVELPKTDRFCIMQAMDAYSNTIDIIECNELEARTTYIFTGPNFEGEIPVGMIEVKCPTNMVWILGRTVCGDNENNAEDKWLITRTIQYQMKMYTLEQLKNGTQDQPLKGEYEEAYDGIVPLNYVIYNLTVDEFFDRANQLMISNPPAEEDAEVMKLFSYIGVGPGLDFDSSKFGTEETTLLYGWIRKNIVQNCVAGSSEFRRDNGVWSYYGEPIGDYGTEYAFRCLIALAGFGANPAEMAIYPAAETDVAGEALIGENAYVIHIDAKQLELLNKHNGFGFWSITAYGTDQYLIANEENRYCINDRNVVYNADGTIDIYVAKEAPEDTEKYPNWLPVGEEGFKLYFRIYLPCNEILNNEWTMPGIEKYVADVEDDTTGDDVEDDTTGGEVEGDTTGGEAEDDTTGDNVEDDTTGDEVEGDTTGSEAEGDTTDKDVEENTGKELEDTKSPETGDSSLIMLWAVICMFALAGICLTKKVVRN